jgi:hypothetical protein
MSNFKLQPVIYFPISARRELRERERERERETVGRKVNDATQKSKKISRGV